MMLSETDSNYTNFTKVLSSACCCNSGGVNRLRNKIAFQDMLSIFIASVHGGGLECSISFRMQYLFLLSLCQSISSYGNLYFNFFK